MNSNEASIREFFDQLIDWLRIIPWPTVFPTLSTGELVFSPFILIGFLFHFRNAIVMCRLWLEVRSEPEDEGLSTSALDRFHRSLRALLRLTVWLTICWVLVVNNPYGTVFFTFGIIAYGVIEAADGLFDWLYQRDRQIYWKAQIKAESFAAEVAQQAREAALRAERAVTNADAKTDQLMDLAHQAINSSKEAAADSREAVHAANNTQEKFIVLSQEIQSVQHEQRVQEERTDTRMEQSDEHHQDHVEERQYRKDTEDNK